MALQRHPGQQHHKLSLGRSVLALKVQVEVFTGNRRAGLLGVPRCTPSCSNMGGALAQLSTVAFGVTLIQRVNRASSPINSKS